MYYRVDRKVRALTNRQCNNWEIFMKRLIIKCAVLSVLFTNTANAWECYWVVDRPFYVNYNDFFGWQKYLYRRKTVSYEPSTCHPRNGRVWCLRAWPEKASEEWVLAAEYGRGWRDDHLQWTRYWGLCLLKNYSAGTKKPEHPDF